MSCCTPIVAGKQPALANSSAETFYINNITNNYYNNQNLQN